jgi:hypothetical protein
MKGGLVTGSWVTGYESTNGATARVAPGAYSVFRFRLIAASRAWLQKTTGTQFFLKKNNKRKGLNY